MSSETPDNSSLSYLYLTTTGRKTGLPREIEIWFVAHQGSYYLVAENREETAWVKNIQSTPQISFRVGSTTFAGVGRTVSPESEPELSAQIAALMDAKYQWSDGLIVELKPSI